MREDYLRIAVLAYMQPNYIETLERLLNHKIQMISVGARRDQYLMKEI